MVIRFKLRDALRPLLATALLSTAGAVGCGDDENPPTTTTRRDSGAERDASDEPKDASTPEMRDATVRPDTGSPEEGLEGNCAIDSNKIMSVTQRNEPFAGMPLAVDAASSVFGLPYVGLQAGCLDVVNFTLLKGGSQGGDPTTKVAIDRCALVKETAATSLQGQWLVAMIDSRQPPFDVWVQRYDGELGEQGDPARISNAAATEVALAITTLRDGEHALAAWGDESSTGNALYTRLVDADGKPVGEPVRIDQSTSLVFRGVSLAPLGSTGAGIAYWRYSADFSTSEIVFRALDATGTPARDAWVLATGAGPNASVDVATDVGLGGILYSVAEGSTGRQVWFQRIDATGQAAQLLNSPDRSPPARIVNPPYKGVDVSVAKLRAGYAVAYRALPALTETRAAIRLMFLDRNGATIGSSDVAYTSEAGGRVAVEAAIDGRVVLGWSQVNSDGKSELKLVRVPCIGG